MGLEEHVEGCQAEKGWKGIPGGGNSCTKAQRLGQPSAWSAEVRSVARTAGLPGLDPCLTPLLATSWSKVFTVCPQFLHLLRRDNDGTSPPELMRVNPDNPPEERRPAPAQGRLQ